jgi:hypothetical protein
MNINLINKQIENLDKHLNENDLSTLENYQKSATLFKTLMETILGEIISQLDSTLQMTINGVDILIKGSVLKGSTAMGFIVEEIFTRIIKDSEFNDKFIFPTETIDSAFDIKYNNDKIDLLCNLKVEKHGEIENNVNNNKISYNGGIVAGKILQTEYAKNLEIPKLYLISKLPYIIDLDNSTLKLKKDIINVFLESFITDGITSDNRNWSQEYNPLSGRLKMPSKKNLEKYSIDTIPEYEKIKELIEHLEDAIG